MGMEARELHVSDELRSKPATGAEAAAKPNRAEGLPASLAALMATACALSVANVYYAQPLLDEMAHDFGLAFGETGVVITICQVGYALGLFLIVPLGDLIDRRRLVVTQTMASAAALAVVGFAPNRVIFLAAILIVGMLAVAVQILVAFAATLAGPSGAGRAVGIVTSGVVVGILMARTIAGALADFGGWRAVYLSSAAGMLLVAGLLARHLPHENKHKSTGYPQLLRSTLTLLLEEPILRERAVFSLLIFAILNVLWAPLVLPLTAPPFNLSHTTVGLFGLVGIAGALGARGAGEWADRGLADCTTGAALALLLAAWLPIFLMSVSLWFLIIGVLMLDFAIQAVHVTNQTLIFNARPEARSRLVAVYMMFYSAGSATGALAATGMFAWNGWAGVCWLGAGLSLIALIFWLTSSRSTLHDSV
ncbi:MAG TPA: MFS transporter [Bradyrhizobium sp.]|nr:MFS transporter [Bradyrhizobium sp.]